MKKLIITALTATILSGTITGVVTNKLTAQDIKRNNVIYTKDYAYENIVDMNNVTDIKTTENGVLIETETDGYYWER
jgi:hypothetical protein